MRRLGVALPVLVVALALVAAPQPPVSDAAGRRVTFGRPVRVSANVNQSAAEPSIRASRDGRIYIVAPQGLTSGISRPDDNGGNDVIWRSNDDGKTWRFLGSFDRPAGGGDADIAPDPSGDLWGSGLTLVNTTAAHSTDKGETWDVNPVGTLETVVDRQWIDAFRGNTAFLTTGRIGEQSILLSRLENTPTGPAVVFTRRISNPGEEEYQWPGEIAVDIKRRKVYVGWNNSRDSVTDDNTNRDDIVVARSDVELPLNTTRSVVTKTQGDSFDSFVAVDTDNRGNVYAVWTERRPKGKGGRRGWTNTYISVSQDKGKTWSRPRRLNNRKSPTTTFPWVVAGGGGKVAVAWYGTGRRGPSPEDVTRKKLRGPKWKVWVAYSFNATADNPRYKKKLAVRKPIHEGNVCTSGTGCATGTRDLLDFFQLDLDACGEIVIAYTDNSRDVVGMGGDRTTNRPELISFVRQNGGRKFYGKPLNRKIC
ncbi:MAG: glycoside hydrolase [Actinomycetota bacterium]|nr:glycoside hydrolase [Actinomycetota bacterium]